MKISKRELKQMIDESVSKILNEGKYKYKDGFARIRAVCHAKGMTDEETNEYIRHLLAKHQAIIDMNSEIRDRRRTMKNIDFDDWDEKERVRRDNEFEEFVNKKTFDYFRK